MRTVIKNRCRPILLLPLLFLSACLSGQQLRPYVEYGYNKSMGSYVAAAAVGDFAIAKRFSVSGGLQLSTANLYAAKASLEYSFPVSERNRFYLENRYLGRWFVGSGTQEYSLALSAGYSNVHWKFQLGYSALFFGQFGGGDFMVEGMGLLYIIEGKIFEKEHKWNIGGRISNADNFMIERFNLPIFSILGDCSLSSKLDFFGVFSLRPTGMANISAQFYGLFIQTGIICNF